MFGFLNYFTVEFLLPTQPVRHLFIVFTGVIKEALRNISRIRRERNEFDRGIIEGQMLHRCHYCGKNYSSAEHGRYQKHVYNHMLQELDGPDYEKGVYVKERECWTKMLAHMTKGRE